MNCKKCGSPLMVSDQFCKNCGATVEDVNAQMMMGQVQNQPSVMPTMESGVNNNMMGNPMNNMASVPPVNNYSEPPKKGNNKTAITVAIIIGVAIFAAIVVLGIFFMTNNDNKKTPPTTEEKGDENGNLTSPTPTPTTSTYTVKSGGFTYKIPDHLIYQTSDEMVMVGDEDETWIAAIMPIEGNFSQIVKAKNQVKMNFKNYGYDVINMEEKTVGDVNTLVFEVDNSGEASILGYAEVNSMYVLGFEIHDVNAEANYDALEEIAPILENAEYNGDYNSIAPDSNLDLNGLLEGISE